MKKLKTFYKIPFYKSTTAMMRLEYAGEIVCYFDTFGVKEAMSRIKIPMLDMLEIERIGDSSYVTDRSILLNYFHNKGIEKDGVKLYVKEEDVNKAKPISIYELSNYCDEYEESEYNKLMKEMALRYISRNNKKKIKN